MQQHLAPGADMLSVITAAKAVNAASGPDTAIDAQIMGLFYVRGSRHIGAHENSGSRGRYVPVASDVWIDPQTDKWVTTAAGGLDFTASLDTAAQLANRLFPHGAWQVDRFGPDEQKRGGAIVRVNGRDCRSMGATPTLALLSAVLMKLVLESEVAP